MLSRWPRNARRERAGPWRPRKKQLHWWDFGCKRRRRACGVRNAVALRKAKVGPTKQSGLLAAAWQRAQEDVAARLAAVRTALSFMEAAAAANSCRTCGVDQFRNLGTLLTEPDQIWSG